MATDLEVANARAAILAELMKLDAFQRIDVLGFVASVCGGQVLIPCVAVPPSGPTTNVAPPGLPTRPRPEQGTHSRGIDLGPGGPTFACAADK